MGSFLKKKCRMVSKVQKNETLIFRKILLFNFKNMLCTGFSKFELFYNVEFILSKILIFPETIIYAISSSISLITLKFDEYVDIDKGQEGVNIYIQGQYEH